MQDKELIVRLDSATFFNEESPTVRNATLEIKSGEFISVIGQSGSGKTTLLKGIAGLLPFRGNVSRFGQMRMVFQQDRLLPWLTARQNVTLGSSKSDTSKAAVEKVLEEMGIDRLGDRHIWQLSGGQRQRVAAARAFVSHPDLVLMDEPFGALDILTREIMQEWLTTYWIKHKIAILFVTHDIEEALIMSDRVLAIADGKLVAETNVPFCRPREQELRFTQEFVRMRRQLRETLLGDTPK